MSIFITIDGPNASGKTSTIKRLYNELAKSKSVFVTKEPTPTEFGEYVKRNEGLLSGIAYAHLIAADRAHHIDSIILPSMKKYDVILCDRYVESSLVLQYYDGVNLDYIWKLNEDFIVPDISVILFATEDILKKRLKKRNVLTSYEKKITRSEEIDLYKNAYTFLKEKNYNPIILNSSNTKDIDRNVQTILEMIANLNNA